METADEFARRFVDRVAGDVRIAPSDVALIDADRTAARLEVIVELERIAENARWNDDKRMLEGIAKLLRSKYAEPQPKEGT